MPGFDAPGKDQNCADRVERTADDLFDWNLIAARVTAGGTEVSSLMPALPVRLDQAKPSTFQCYRSRSGSVTALSLVDGRQLRPRQRTKFDPMRHFGVGAEAGFAVGFVIGIIAVEPYRFAVAFEG